MTVDVDVQTLKTPCVGSLQMLPYPLTSLGSYSLAFYTNSLSLESQSLRFHSWGSRWCSSTGWHTRIVFGDLSRSCRLSFSIAKARQQKALTFLCIQGKLLLWPLHDEFGTTTSHASTRNALPLISFPLQVARQTRTNKNK